MSDLPEVSGYALQAELGRGGMAVVYSAIETGLDRQVAIKIVSVANGDPDGHIQRLENEARGLAALHHPHIVDLYRFGRTSDGALYYVMPLLPGGSLEDWPKPTPEARVVALLDTLLDALGHAHASDIIHRDIKPANILFDRHDRPLLADFGAAFMRRRDTRLTSHGEAIGSSGYMSPEQARGQAVDARSDLYSVAVLAFELLVGQLPFTGEDALATALAQIEQPVPRLPAALRHWQAFFDRALAVNPEHRFRNTAAMRSAIRQLEAPRARRGKGPVIALVAGVLALGVVAAAVWNARAPAEPAVTPAAATQARFGNATAPIEPAAVATVQAPPAIPQQPASPVAIGDRFADEGGPGLVLARLAKGSRPALAVMAAPVDSILYQRFAKEGGRRALGCKDAPAPAQGCLDLATARELAAWLGKQTGQGYRVPTRPELDASISQVATTPAYAWTSTCREVRVARPRNAAQRGWAKVRKAVGKPKSVRYDLRCDGHHTLKLDGRGDASRARDGATADTVVVLVRDVPAKVE